MSQNKMICDSVYLDLTFKRTFLSNKTYVEVEIKNKSKQSVFFQPEGISPAEYRDSLKRKRLELSRFDSPSHNHIFLTEIRSEKRFRKRFFQNTDSVHKSKFVFLFLSRMDLVRFNYNFKEKQVEIDDLFFLYNVRTCSVEKTNIQ